MARKADKYVIGILFVYEDRTEIKYVTKSDNIEKISYWEDGKEAMTFSKDDAKYLAWALCLNGNNAIPILKADYIILKNPEKKESDNNA